MCADERSLVRPTSLVRPPCGAAIEDQHDESLRFSPREESEIGVPVVQSI